MSYRSFSAKVSRSRAGQSLRIRQRAPRRVRKRERQLVGRQRRAVDELAHQVRLAQAAWRNHQRVAAAFWLRDEDGPLGIKSHFDRTPTELRAHIVEIAAHSKYAIEFCSAKPATGAQVLVDPLHIQHVRLPLRTI